MNNLKKTSRRSRLNYVITYLDTKTATSCRSFVHSVLIAVATLRRIDYAIEVDTPMLDEIRSSLSTDLQDIVTDLVYFRSSSGSLSSIKEFRQIVDSLFQGNDVISHHDSFEVMSLGQKLLKDYPFPVGFYRPLSYPFVEVHNGKKSSLCVTGANLLGVLSEDMSPRMN